jgi:hypothetical protein
LPLISSMCPQIRCSGTEAVMLQSKDPLEVRLKIPAWAAPLLWFALLMMVRHFW